MIAKTSGMIIKKIKIIIMIIQFMWLRSVCQMKIILKMLITFFNLKIEILIILRNKEAWVIITHMKKAIKLKRLEIYLGDLLKILHKY